MSKLLIFIVIYKSRLEECNAFTSTLRNAETISVPHEIIAYNNSPEIGQEAKHCLIMNGKGNDMLAKAYNAGLRMAREKNCEWMLLMDQDTPFCADFFRETCHFIENPCGCDMAVPIIEAGGKVASPTYYHPVVGPYLSSNPLTQTGRYEKYLTAFNSGAVLRVGALEGLGGFNEEYPLDALDNWYFHHLRENGHRTYVMKCRLKQDLSLSNPSEMSVARYKSIMNSAIRFAKSIGWVALLGWKVRAVARCAIQLASPPKRKFAPLTFKYLFVNKIK